MWKKPCKVCNRIKTKVSVPWNLRSVSDTNLLMPTDVSNNFTKKYFS